VYSRPNIRSGQHADADLKANTRLGKGLVGTAMIALKRNRFGLVPVKGIYLTVYFAEAHDQE
jgi:hypothetical protein